MSSSTTTSNPQKPSTTTPNEEDTSTHTLTAPSITVVLTSSPLSTSHASASVRSPHAGATVLFLGTTRSTSPPSPNLPHEPVAHLSYSAYIPLALQTLLSISQQMKKKHQLEKVYVAHRLGEVGIGEESVVVAVSAPHRGAAWRAGEECLEEVKKRVEVWKREVFEGGGADGGKGEGGRGGEGVWRANWEVDAEGKRVRGGEMREDEARGSQSGVG